MCAASPPVHRRAAAAGAAAVAAVAMAVAASMAALPAAAMAVAATAAAAVAAAAEAAAAAAAAAAERQQQQRGTTSRARAHLHRVQLVARAALEWVVQVHDDNVEASGRLLEHGLGVVDDEFEPRVLERLGVLRQVLAAEAHDVLVDVHHHAALHGGVAEDLTSRGALAATANVDRLWARVREQRRVHQRLVVHKLVHLARLDEAVDQQRAAKRLEVDDIHRLEL